ncbi:enoyl-CoA hydratase/isomerase family protein [Amycolatopsis sp.]|uniref:enoyl-CoA hydratase/isomerase family protein n=1 Tax=Amycolatopsis sp. TaxID=37632 RepID=UPI002C4CAECC|nr:enoyl-CoA hydratase/isomerase family protein [Amycolatopsis sp.]HVV08386.1 enoyl-CoA hydratase/isomerase family protein [Amycolatopsis sp.]
MNFTDIAYHKGDGVAEIRLNRPDSRNPISANPGGTRDQIVAALIDAEGDSSVGAVLVSGAGSCFSAGGDLAGNARRETAVEHFRFREDADEFYRRIRISPLPLVAAVHGYCLGAGLILAASCDLVLAAGSARLGMPEGRIGMPGASHLVELVGRQWAKFLMLTGELIDGRRACEIGLATVTVADDDLGARSADLAARLARMPRDAVMLNKRAIDAVADAAGTAAGRLAGHAHDVVTLEMSNRATAPDGRSFREIRDAEGVAGLKAARSAQYEQPWLRP